jgi:hypothetical protein
MSHMLLHFQSVDEAIRESDVRTGRGAIIGSENILNALYSYSQLKVWLGRNTLARVVARQNALLVFLVL